MLTGLMADQLGSRQMPTEVVWQAVLGVTSQYLSGHLHEGLYSEYCHFLKVYDLHIVVVQLFVNVVNTKRGRL